MSIDRTVYVDKLDFKNTENENMDNMKLQLTKLIKENEIYQRRWKREKSGKDCLYLQFEEYKAFVKKDKVLYILNLACPRIKMKKYQFR